MVPISGRKRGFTLIELLVVIAIIAILAAILFPVFAQARAKARQAQCLSNQKQVGLGFMQYTQDYDETFPMNNASYGGNIHAAWMQHLQPYIKNVEVYKCTNSRYNNTLTIPGPGGSTTGQIVVPSHHIGANEFIVKAGGATETALSLAAINSPALLALAADCTYPIWNDAPRVFNAEYSGSTSGYPATPDPSMARHNGGSVVMYCDGHVKWNAQGQMGPDPARASAGWARNYRLIYDPNDDRLK